MSEVRSKGNYEQWIKFFLQAIYESADDAAFTADKLVTLHDSDVGKILAMGRASNSTMRIFEYLETSPIIDIGKTAEALGMSFATASGAVNRLIKADILVQSGKSGRNRTFSYKRYLDILRNGT